VRLIPEVGTIRTSTAATPRHARHWYRSSVLHAEAMGIKPYLFQDAPAWLAASTFGFRSAPAQERLASTSFLPTSHPLYDMPQTGTAVQGIARLSASLGRPDQAIQISTASNTGIEMTDLLDTAVRAMRNRPSIDLLRLLSGQTDLKTAAETVKMLRASTQNLMLNPVSGGLNVQLQETEIAAGTASFFDISLQGQEAFSLVFNALEGGNCTVRASIIDQSTGSLLGRLSAAATPGVARTHQIDLHGIYGMFCLMLEISATSRGKPSLVFSSMQFS
jgi:hypothetical protein